MSDRVFNVTAVSDKARNWTGKYGDNTDYSIQLEGLEGWHVLTQKAQSPAPTVGQELFGRPEPGGTWDDGNPKPPKFKKAQQQQNSGGGNRSKDPAERESIERQVAAKVASDLLVALMAQGTFKPEGVAALGDAHSKLAATVAGGIRV